MIEGGSNRQPQLPDEEVRSPLGLPRNQYCAPSGPFHLLQMIRAVHAVAEVHPKVCVPAADLPKFEQLRSRFGLELAAFETADGGRPTLRSSPLGTATESQPDLPPEVVPVPVEIDHATPRTIVGDVSRPLLFPRALVRACREMWATERQRRVSFVGLLTPQRVERIESWVADNPEVNPAAQAAGQTLNLRPSEHPRATDEKPSRGRKRGQHRRSGAERNSGGQARQWLRRLFRRADSRADLSHANDTAEQSRTGRSDSPQPNPELSARQPLGHQQDTRDTASQTTAYNFGDLHLWSSTRGREFPVKSWDESYYEVLADSKFVLCPNGDFIWSYRFFESILCGAIPIVQDPCAAYEGFKFARWSDPFASLVYDQGTAEQNAALAIERLTIPISDSSV